MAPLHARKAMKKCLNTQTGASLIEVLVAVLILSFGLLSLGGMLTFAVQMPKLSGYRATAANIVSNYVERVRANPNAFANNLYTSALSYDGTFTALAESNCSYPDCTEATLATMDNAAINSLVRLQLPAGGMIMRCGTLTSTTICTKAEAGNLWVVWQEPSTFAVLDPTNSDNCPSEVTAHSPAFDPKPRCLHVRFKVE
jgi:type IV pilus assembly protein PilV